MADPTGEAEAEGAEARFRPPTDAPVSRFRDHLRCRIAGLSRTGRRARPDAIGWRELADARTGKNGRHRLVGLLRQSVFGRLAGYEDVNDAERLCRDPAMRWVVGGKAAMSAAASASQMGRFETEWLAAQRTSPRSPICPASGSTQVHRRRPPRCIVLDMDSSESPTYGEQEGSAYNGHFGCTCYHPLFVFNQFGDLERCALRPGNVHSATAGGRCWSRWSRATASATCASISAATPPLPIPRSTSSSKPRAIDYAIRLPANRVLQDKIGYLLKRPVGRPPHEVRRYYASFSYQAQSWKKPRRVVAKVEWHPGELYPARRLHRHQSGALCRARRRLLQPRGTCEQ